MQTLGIVLIVACPFLIIITAALDQVIANRRMAKVWVEYERNRVTYREQGIPPHLR